jgi:hypothetical protein
MFPVLIVAGLSLTKVVELLFNDLFVAFVSFFPFLYFTACAVACALLFVLQA